MNKFIVFTFLVFNLFCFSQNKKINLPQVIENLGSLSYPYFSVEVLDEDNIIFQKDTIPIKLLSNNIFLNSKMFKSYGLNSLYIKTYVHLFADENLNYNIIDEIKTQISRTNKSRYVIYRSNFDKQVKRGTRREGIKHKSPLSFFKLEIPEYRETLKQIKKKDSLRKLQEEKFPDIAEMNRMLDDAKGNWKPIYQIETLVYGSQKDVIKEYLENKTTKCYRITNDGFKSNLKVYKRNEISDVLNKSEIIFLDYDEKLTYLNYLKFIKELHKSIPNFGQKNVDTEVVELSNEIKKIHRMTGVELCN
ncbi:hypothetical protein [uncultured Winogradskyella sp.]|uniref:hypothetical protein n=1 Tax=uncultured Winogradskyella sp. TaxID=395353 RepID=UPI00261205BB|nr:hypothetical protein [uncultured Winogradskyella sp.]